MQSFSFNKNKLKQMSMGLTISDINAISFVLKWKSEINLLVMEEKLLLQREVSLLS